MSNHVTLSTADGKTRGEFTLKEVGGRKFALIGSRWCRIGRRHDGLMVEVWFERGLWLDAAGNVVGRHIDGGE